MRVSAPGIYTMSFADYLADPCPEPSLSASVAHILCSKSPAHARHCHPRLNPDYRHDQEEHFNIGTVAHAILLEGVSTVQILEFDDFRTKAAREARDLAHANGKVPLLAKVWADVEAMVNAMRDQLDAHRDGRAMFRHGQAEQTLVWQEGAVWCRARLDWLRHPIIADSVDGSRYVAIDDYKSTKASANPESLSRTAFSHGWDIKAVFYLRGLKAITGDDAEFRFAVQECWPPYALSVVDLAPSTQMLAEKKVRYALDAWQTALETDHWRGYADRTASISLPPWIEAEWLQREEEDLAHAG